MNENVFKMIPEDYVINPTMKCLRMTKYCMKASRRKLLSGYKIFVENQTKWMIEYNGSLQL